MTVQQGETASPFERALGAQFHRLSPQVRQLHGGRVSEWRGQVSVSHGGGFLASMSRKLGGFPPAMERAPFALSVTRQSDGSELWRRDFNGFKTLSHLWFDPARECLMERFGIVTCALRPFEKLDALHIEVDAGWIWGGVPLSGPLLPASEVAVWQDEAGRYRFEVAARLGRGSPIVGYKGWLRAEN